MNDIKRIFCVIAVFLVLAPSLTGGRMALAQEGEDDPVLELMDSMSSAARVGQLFMVTFPGSEVTDDALINRLIRDYHIGGVVLSPQNGNIINEGNTPEQVATFVGQLQQTAWEASQAITDTDEAETNEPFIPLFMAVSYEGNGMPYTSIVNGTTPLPSAMSLGATWDLNHVESIGNVVGQELNAMGINMLLGPSLDVLETPRPESAGDLSVRAFGGDPFWVGQMGQAYIRGVHTGSDGQVAVIATHFPGLGASDRSLDEEVSTVQRTLEKLRQVDLAPFFSVASAEDPLARPEGVVVSHIRFQGLQGGRFVRTRPVSVDSQLLPQLLAIPELIPWREGGGVTLSDALGLRALRRFYDPSEQTFNGRRIAPEAFLAGNDILYLSQFALTDDWEAQALNIESTIAFFLERYETDPAFHDMVDAAVERILRLKMALYGETFRLNGVRPNVDLLSGQVGGNQDLLPAIGRDAVTLLSPPSYDLVPAPPTSEENIVIFTDSRTETPCSVCEPVPYIDPTELEDTIVRLYGPSATRQVTPWRTSSFTFEQLDGYLNRGASLGVDEGEAETEADDLIQTVEEALQGADWIIFAMLDPLGEPPQSNAVRQFLAQEADQLRDPNLVVLAYDAPYYLDATEISKLSAYFVVYSHIDAFIEASVRALFGEFVPTGTSPVSVAGISYDLSAQTAPDPNQLITLYIGDPQEADGEPVSDPPQIQTGDVLQIYTSVIVDRNGNPVPDGTPVQFFFTYFQEGLEYSITGLTEEGVASASAVLERMGEIDISVQSDPIARTVLLHITIQEGEPPIIVSITPTPRPTPEPTLTPTPDSGDGEGPVTEPSDTSSDQESGVLQSWVGFGDLSVALICVLVAASVTYYVMRLNKSSISESMRLALWAVIGGMGCYLIYALRLPGAIWLREQSGLWAAGWVAMFGSALALVIAWTKEFVQQKALQER